MAGYIVVRRHVTDHFSGAGTATGCV